MRRIVSSLFLSLDGIAEAPNRFVFPYFDDEVGKEVGEAMVGPDTVLLGRRTYEEWSTYWPTKTAADDPFAGYINPIRKVVVSTTLREANWENTTVVRALEPHVRALKDESGGGIAVHGSISLARSLLAAGLLDELRLLVFPIVVGSGKRLFDGSIEGMPLTLVEERRLPTGVLSLVYTPPPAAETSDMPGQTTDETSERAA